VTESPHYARLAARVLGRRPAEPRVDTADRDRGITVVAQAMAARARRLRARRWLFGSTAAAALLGATLSGWLLVPGESSKLSRRSCAEGCGEAVDPLLIGHAGSSRYPPGSHLRSGSEPLTVTFGPITRLELNSTTEVVYRSSENVRRFRLLYGSLRLQVEKLRPEQRLIVETGDSEVEVRGTTFDVAWLPGPTSCGSSTRVAVSEGSVEVRAAGALHAISAGRNWPPACAADVEAKPVTQESAPARQLLEPSERLLRPTPSRATDTAREASSPVQTGTVPPPEPVERTPSSSLSAQNDLYARALAARRAGNSGLALDLYERLLQRFPGSPLIESALIERVRILASVDRARAGREARRYLSRFPGGFGRGKQKRS
jgi:hypothetical protein